MLKKILIWISKVFSEKIVKIVVSSWKSLSENKYLEAVL